MTKQAGAPPSRESRAQRRANDLSTGAIDRRISVEHVDIDLLRPSDDNPRVMPGEEMLALERSIDRFGLVDPVVVRRQDRRIIGGHQRVVADAPGTERTLDWSAGWHNDGWTGADGMPPEDVFDCADGSYAAAYRLVGGGWERHFPDRPGISTMGPLDEYDAFLILVTAPVSCSMPIAP